MAGQPRDRNRPERRGPLSAPAAMVLGTFFIWTGLAVPTTTLFIMRSGATTPQDVGLVTVLAAAAAASTLGVWWAGRQRDA